MRRKFKQKLKRIRTYLKISGFKAFPCILDELLNLEKIRVLEIAQTKIYLRTNTPDLQVAVSSLVDGEYEQIRCKDPQFIVDAGANIGTSAVHFAKKYPEASIIAIEPEEGNYEMLLKNTQGYPNVTAIKAAIWGSDDKRTIQNRNTGHWGYTISETENQVESTGQEIDCLTINSLMKKHEKEFIDILKMDIEGGEKDVLEKSSEWIDAVNVITVELHDRICMGCDRAFYLATQDFKTFEKHGEKVTAYRD